MRVNCQITGLNNTLRQLAPGPVKKDISAVTEKYAHKMASESAQKAPVLTSALANSITASVRQEGDHTWTWGSHLEYATRQEYEHASRSGFVRQSVWDNQPLYYRDIQNVLNRMGRSL